MSRSEGACRPTPDEIARRIATRLFPNDPVRLIQALTMISKAIIEVVSEEVLWRTKYEEGLRKAAEARLAEVENKQGARTAS